MRKFYAMVKVLVAIFLLSIYPKIGLTADFPVTTNVDAIDASPGDGNCAAVGGECTLRAAVMESNALAGNDIISLSAGTYTLTILGKDEVASETGDLDITSNMTIKNVDAPDDVVVIDAIGLSDRVFNVISGDVKLENLVIKNGLLSDGTGGGIYCTNITSTLTLTNCSIENNTAKYGGGIYGNWCTIVINNSTINDNTATEGGGIYNTSASSSKITLVNSTVSGNTASLGGGIMNYKKILLFNSTIADNEASGANGGGIWNDQFGNISLKNSIIAGNSNGNSPDCYGQFDSSGYNLVGNQGMTGLDEVCVFTSTTGDQVGNKDNPIDAKLVGLASNGGPTKTHALQLSSLAVDAGNPNGCVDKDGAVLATDQRGEARYGPCDIGAFEFGSCGDAYLQTAAGEGCDDGNADDNDYCSNACVSTSCGDGVVQASVEACDNGASNSDTVADACRTKCIKAYCSDSVVDTGEECDDGNTADGDGCSSVCAKEVTPTPPSSTPTDTDGDGIEDAKDNCASKANADQTDTDADGMGDECDDTPTGSVSGAGGGGDDGDGNGGDEGGVDDGSSDDVSGNDNGGTEPAKSSGGCSLIR